MDEEKLTDADVNRATAQLLFQGLEPMRPVDHERGASLTLAMVEKDDARFNEVLGAALNDESGGNRFAGIVGVIVWLADMNASNMLSGFDDESGPLIVANMLKSSIKASLRDSE